MLVCLTNGDKAVSSRFVYSHHYLLCKYSTDREYRLHPNVMPRITFLHTLHSVPAEDCRLNYRGVHQCYFLFLLCLLYLSIATTGIPTSLSFPCGPIYLLN